ncbi:MAG TPA: hypothetical protein VGO50_20425 [Pyrinomonadaceae bacterium]|jgi:hypothetical protein|nr:hypothetical protein [Pyrinomonadaceae bacterium]
MNQKKRQPGRQTDKSVLEWLKEIIIHLLLIGIFLAESFMLDYTHPSWWTHAMVMLVSGTLVIRRILGPLLSDILLLASAITPILFDFYRVYRRTAKYRHPERPLDAAETVKLAKTLNPAGDVQAGRKTLRSAKAKTKRPIDIRKETKPHPKPGK